MSWRSGTTRYLVREPADQVVKAICEQLRTEGLVPVTKPTLRGVRLRIKTATSTDTWPLPAFEVGVIELRFARVEDLTEVSVRGRLRRRWWVPLMLGTLGLLALGLDLLFTIGSASAGLIRSTERAQAYHRDHDPRLLHTVARFLGPRDIGRLDATPFRRELSEAK